MKQSRKSVVFVLIVLAAGILCTGCTSLSGERLSAPYLILLWAGVPVGFFLSAWIWGNDDAGGYTPVWEVAVWLLLVAAGAAAGYSKSFCLFSGFAAAVLIPVVGILPVTLVVHVIRKFRK